MVHWDSFFLNVDIYYIVTRPHFISWHVFLFIMFINRAFPESADVSNISPLISNLSQVLFYHRRMIFPQLSLELNRMR